MNLHDESRLAEHHIDFLRQLSNRTEVIGRRLHRFLQSGWDINGLWLIHADASRLGEACARHGLGEAGEHLLAMAGLLKDALEQQVLPDSDQGERLWRLVEQISALVPRASDPAYDADSPRLLGNRKRAELPPPNYWRRWGDGVLSFAGEQDDGISETAAQDPGPWDESTQRDTLDAAKLPIPPGQPDRPAVLSHASGPEDAVAIAPFIRPTAKPMTTPSNPSQSQSVPAGFRIYHLTSHGALSLELDQRLEAQGVEIELLEDAQELNELLGALPADLTLIDASFSSQLEGIGETVRTARARSGKRLLLVAISEADDITLRLSARRAGVDALVVDPHSADEVLKRLHTLLDPERDTPFRILIVEDDRSQALFAEGILRNAGMDTLVVVDALGTMPALEQFQPDLILMDLNMPDANGIELTSLIREQEAFENTPIVFLSGECDQDLQFDAIDAGGDDFLSKPIRPKYLIAAVQNRVRRHRSVEQRQQKRPTKDTVTGLTHRGALLEQLGQCLNASPRKGGLLFLEIESLALLRERIGLSALEQLLGEVSRLLSSTLDQTAVARFGDGSYLVLDDRRNEAELDALAAQLRNMLIQHPFQAQGHPLRLRLSVGICALAHELGDTGAFLNAVEKIARQARNDERGIRHYEPPKVSETSREAALLAQIRQAISHHGLELLYQPVVAVAGSEDSQYQVLLRLRDASGKLLSAAEVIPMAESSDLIVDIDRWVLLQALAKIRDQRLQERALRLFVTQSPLTLADPGQAEWLKAELASHDVPGTSLVIELRLEDAAVHAATVRQFCDAMVSDGVQFCLSQFEANADTESLLQQLPLGFVKLARKYTAGNLSSELRDELKTAIDRAHRRGLEVIGHSVEDAQSAATLWMSGIDFIQGNLVQRADRELDFDFNQAVL